MHTYASALLNYLLHVNHSHQKWNASSLDQDNWSKKSIQRALYWFFFFCIDLDFFIVLLFFFFLFFFFSFFFCHDAFFEADKGNQTYVFDRLFLFAAFNDFNSHWPEKVMLLIRHEDISITVVEYYLWLQFPALYDVFLRTIKDVLFWVPWAECGVEFLFYFFDLTLLNLAGRLFRRGFNNCKLCVWG